tara:strand:- start:202 stop:459 length:258 start_codon:yes stop_codon:yes gene_type:complete
LLIAAFFSFVTGLVNTMGYIDNHNLIGMIFSAALTSFALSLGAIMASLCQPNGNSHHFLTTFKLDETPPTHNNRSRGAGGGVARP